MFVPLSTSPRAALGKSVLAGLLTLLLLAFSLASRSSSLHGFLHDDYQSAQHHCLLAVLADGHIDEAGVALAIPPAPAPAAFFPAARPDLYSAFDYSLLPIRGPPAWS